MNLQILHDKTTIAKLLKSSPELHIYSIGDLDDFFWPMTIWFSLHDGDTLHGIALLYVGMDTPTLLCFNETDSSDTYQLLTQMKSVLPVKFNAHLSPGLVDVLGTENVSTFYGLHDKMALKKVVFEIYDNHIRRLTVDDLPVVKDFYTISYPHNWFDKRMLETTKYYGYFINDMLVGVAGVHVFSEEYRVAGLGNVAVHPEYRNQQIGYKLTSVLCCDLQKCVDFIGLNVKSTNIAAIKCYEKIGFVKIGQFEEYLMQFELIDGH
jgi:ribosomal protein S18 acetylase RimI-like enzyme